jgi:hypothetical protein
MSSDHGPAEVRVILSRDQALVLSDWLERWMHDSKFAELVDDRAVWSALLRIAGTLDTKIVEIFDPGYEQALAQARERLIVQLGDFGIPDEPS